MKMKEKSRMWLPPILKGGGVYDKNDFITYYKITIFCTMCRNYYHICLNYSFS